MAVATMIGIKSNPALYSEAQRLNSYVDAFKGWFPQKIRGKDAIGKLTLAGDKTLNGHAGREYRLTIADLNGTAQVFVTRKRFYAIVVLNTKKDDALQEKFLGSFVLPEKSAEVQANVAPKPENQEAPAAPADPEPGKTKPPLSGGVLNGKALSLPKPVYPPGDASGTVVVQVLIDEHGNVVEARAVSGPQTLYDAAVNAAREAKFSPTKLRGEPVKVQGVITYDFTR